MSTITPTFNEFKILVKEFIVSAPTAAMDELEAGKKCIAIAFISIKYDSTPLGKIDQHTAPIVLEMAMSAYRDRLAALIVSQPQSFKSFSHGNIIG